MRYRVEHLRGVFLASAPGSASCSFRNPAARRFALGGGFQVLRLVAASVTPRAEGSRQKPLEQVIVFGNRAVRGRFGMRFGNLLSWPVPHNQSFKPKLLRNSA